MPGTSSGSARRAMRIDQPRTEERDGLYLVSATVHWEDVDRPEQGISYGVPTEYAPFVAPLSETFLTVATLPAMRLGERRVTIDGEICPELCEGLEDSMAWICRWRPGRRPVRLDVRLGCAHARGDSERVAGALMSGGVDAFSLLRFNHLRYPADHPRHIRIGIVVRGLWGVEMSPDTTDIRARLQRAQQALSPVADSAGITLVPVFTNLHNLSDGNMTFWQYEYQGAALASFGHLLAPRLDVLSIASTWDIAHLKEWGSHPALDHNYGSHDLAVRHEMARWSRPSKLRLLAGWPLTVESLRVCNRQPEADRNCGECEKCLRTMLALLAFGMLDRAATFPHDDLKPDQLGQLYVPHTDVEGDYRETAQLLTEAGRDDLASAIHRRLRLSRVLRRARRFRRTLGRFEPHVLKGARTHAAAAIRAGHHQRGSSGPGGIAR